MKLGSVLSTLAAATFVVAQPALGATRSASSLPAVGTKVSSLESRVGSRVAQNEDLVLGSAMFLAVAAVIGIAAALLFVVADEDSFDDIDDLPDSP
jgi:hypothetical protein